MCREDKNSHNHRGKLVVETFREYRVVCNEEANNYTRPR